MKIFDAYYGYTDADEHFSSKLIVNPKILFNISVHLLYSTVKYNSMVPLESCSVVIYQILVTLSENPIYSTVQHHLLYKVPLESDIVDKE